MRDCKPLADQLPAVAAPEPSRAPHAARVAVQRRPQRCGDPIRERPRLPAAAARSRRAGSRVTSRRPAPPRRGRAGSGRRRARVPCGPRSARARPRRPRRPARRASRSRLPRARRALPRGSRARARARRGTSRCSRPCRSSRPARASRRRAARASGLCPHSPAIAFGPVSPRPSTTTPPPVPVPTITPNTTRAPAAAPSVASESAKQLASLAQRTGPAERPRQVLVDRAPDEPGRVRVLDEPARRRQRPRHAHAHAALVRRSPARSH